jgi:hypothetical protein
MSCAETSHFGLCRRISFLDARRLRRVQPTFLTSSKSRSKRRNSIAQRGGYGCSTQIK